MDERHTVVEDLLREEVEYWQQSYRREIERSVTGMEEMIKAWIGDKVQIILPGGMGLEGKIEKIEGGAVLLKRQDSMEQICKIEHIVLVTKLPLIAVPTIAPINKPPMGGMN